MFFRNLSTKLHFVMDYGYRSTVRGPPGPESERGKTRFESNQSEKAGSMSVWAEEGKEEGDIERDKLRRTGK